MHPRNHSRVSARLALVAVAAALSACAVAPPSRTETASIRQIREDYLHAYPEGRFNDHIQRGEVVKGMSLFEVLASWGIPDGRAVKPDENRERWIYVLVDDKNLDWVRYDFVFRSNELTEWEKTTNVASGAALNMPDKATGPLPLPAWAYTTPGTGAPRR